MPINYKDISELTEETNIAGTEKVPVSGTKYVLFNKIKDWIINSLKTTGLDLGGKEIKNAGFEVVTSLPTANNFVGRRVTFNNKDYIWNGTEWESNRNWLSVYIATTTPYMYAKLFTVNNPFQNIELNLRPYVYHSGNPSSVNYLISFAYNRVVINKLSSNPVSYHFHYNLHIKKLTANSFEIYVGMPHSNSYTDRLYADITNVRNSIVSSVELFQTLDTSDTNVWTSLLYDDLYFTEFHSLKTNRLKVNGASISDESINYDTNNIEPTQSGTVTKTSTWLWQYLTQSINFLWLKLKGLFPTTQATTHNYLPKIDNELKKLVKSIIFDDATPPKYGANTIWHSGNDGSSSGLDADLLDSKHATDFAQLVNGKILEGNLPDYIFGQVLFGGFIAISISTNQLVCTLSAKFKSKYNITENFLVLENMPASTYEGVYFMATNSWGTPPNDAQVGDWIISNGISWEKVDNTDAVSSVNGQTGAVVLTHTEVGAASSNHTHNYESLANLPENISMGEFVPSEVNFENITETCIYPLLYGYKYYSVPNKICGTDGVTEDLEGFLFVYKKHDIVSQQLHDTINNSLYIRSFDRNSDEWNQWEKIITCKASYGEQGNSPEVTENGFDLDEQGTPVNTFYHIDTSGYDKYLTINIPLDNVDNYLRDNGPDMGEFKITLMFSSLIHNPTLAFSVPSPSVVSNAYIVNGTDPSGHSNISGLEIIIKWWNMGGGFLFSVIKVNIL